MSTRRFLTQPERVCYNRGRHSTGAGGGSDSPKSPNPYPEEPTINEAWQSIPSQREFLKRTAAAGAAMAGSLGLAGNVHAAGPRRDPAGLGRLRRPRDRRRGRGPQQRRPCQRQAGGHGRRLPRQPGQRPGPHQVAVQGAGQRGQGSQVHPAWTAAARCCNRGVDMVHCLPAGSGPGPRVRLVKAGKPCSWRNQWLPTPPASAAFWPPTPRPSRKA